MRGIGGSGARGIELWHDGGHAERGVEECEDREDREIHFAGTDAVSGADETDLRLEHPVLVAHALRRAGGAGGEEDGGEVVGLRGRGGEDGHRAAGEAVGGIAADEEPAADGVKRGSENPRRHLCLGDAEEHAWLGAQHAFEEVFAAHARIDHDGRRTEFEEGEDGGDQRQSWTYEYEHAVAALHAGAGEAPGPGVGLGGQFGEGERGVADGAVACGAGGDTQRRRGGLLRSHGPEVAGDVDDLGFGHCPIKPAAGRLGQRKGRGGSVDVRWSEDCGTLICADPR